MKNAINPDSISGYKAQYDMQVKKLLSQKVILAWIFRRTMKEFKGMEIAEIMDCIEGTPEISSVSVEPTTEIHGQAQEEYEQGEGYITYDIRTFVRIPLEKGLTKVLVNIEAQKAYYPGYEIVTRGIFYACRMISAQKHTEFEKSDYNRIKKVYSIWLCLDAPVNIGNTISAYHMTKEELLGNIPVDEAAYDKLEVVIATLNESCETDDTFMQMMGMLLSRNKVASEKLETLEKKYQISSSRELEKEVNQMCNLSDLIEEKGKAEGIELGKAEGIAQGKAEGIEEGERRLAKLMKYLSENNLADEMKLAFSDENARKALYEKYNI